MTKDGGILYLEIKWLWVKIKQPGDRRFEFIFPFTRVEFWVPISDPQPNGAIPQLMIRGVANASSALNQILETCLHVNPETTRVFGLKR